jgi:hypothetical protein
MKASLGFCGASGRALAILAILCALTGVAAFAAGELEMAQTGFYLSAVFGGPGFFLWRLGIGRRRRQQLVLSAVEAVGGNEAWSVESVAARIGQPIPQTAWCLQSAAAKDLLKGRVVDVASGQIRIAVPAIAEQSTPMIAALSNHVAPAAPPPLPAAPARAASYQIPAEGEDWEDDELQNSDEEGNDGEEARAELIQSRLRTYRQFVHRRNCRHCDYYGRMGVTKQVDRQFTRLAGSIIHSSMGRSGLSRMLTSGMRKQKNQKEAVCPSCSEINYYDA